MPKIMTAASAATMMKVPRQLATSAMSAAKGMPATIAIDQPVMTCPMARERIWSGVRSAVIA